MTKKAALLGAATLLFATAAVAQPAPPPPDGPRGGPETAPPPPPPPPPSKGAHFIFERGDARIDVKCADDEPMKVCADITLQMLDKLSTLKPADAR
jgi:hypothetical protein